MTETYLRDLLLQDAPILSDWLGDEAPLAARSPRDGKPTISAMRDYIRMLKSSPNFTGMAWIRSDESVDVGEAGASNGSASNGSASNGGALDANTPAGKAQVVNYLDGNGQDENTPDGEDRVLGFLFFEQTALRRGTLQIEILLDPDAAAPTEQEAEELLDLIFQHTGADETVKVISLHIPEEYAALAKTTESLPIPNDGGRYSVGRSARGLEERWLRIFTFSKTVNWPYTWVFVPAPSGLIGVSGNATQITYVKWFDYGKLVEDVGVRELCMADGFADDFGVMKDYSACAAVGAAGVAGSAVGIVSAPLAVGAVGTPPIERVVPDVLREAAKQLREYLAGERRAFDLPLVIKGGTGFQRRVWQTIGQIPYGATASYEEIGTAVAQGDRHRGRELSRSVGMACGANPLVVFVPCHRVIAKDGKLRGYAYGVERKDFLLSLELLGRGQGQGQGPDN